MEHTLQQLGELLLGAIPTVVLLLVLFGMYRVLIGGPLERVLHERYARTEGALEQAKRDIGASETRTAEYEQRIREARTAIFSAMERRRQQAVEARGAAAAQARAASEIKIKQARQEIEKETVVAKAGLQQESERLAGDIIHAVLSQGTAASPTGGAQ
jgi:F-type H+-transporting ATPase subunit b